MAVLRTSIAKGGLSIAAENPRGAPGLCVGGKRPTQRLSRRRPPLQCIYHRWDPSQSDDSNFAPHLRRQGLSNIFSPIQRPTLYIERSHV
jgi:hypothetical protein